MKTKYLILLIPLISLNAFTQNVWKGNDYLNNVDWRENDWGLVAWNSTLQQPTNGFWGYDSISVVPDPYDPTHDVIRVKFYEDGVTTESGCGLLFSPDLSFLQNPKKACLSYNILLDNDFEWGQIGGKFPGLYGYNSNMGTPNATTCAGPNPIDSEECFSARISWRGLPNQGYDTTRMFYELIPWMNEDTCHPNWVCNLPFGEGMTMLNNDPPSFEATHGNWTNIKQEILLNDDGQSNGYMRVWYNDTLVYNEQDLEITKGDDVKIYGILFHVLFGQGFNLNLGSPITQYCYLSDFMIADSYTELTNLTTIEESEKNSKRLIKIVDVLGREITGIKNEPLFYIYDDGTVEKKIILE